MKIVVTGTRGIPDIMGGVETHCEQLFPRIASLGYDVTVIRRKGYVTADSDRDVHDGQWNGVKVCDIDVPKKKSFEAIVHTFRAINKAKALGADVVHIHAIGPALLVPYAKLLGMKVVFTHHGFDYHRDKWGYAAKKILKLGEALGCRLSDHVIAISADIKSQIANAYGRRKNLYLIYNGVPEAEICHEPQYFKDLGIEEGKYVLAMTRFAPEKRLNDLIDAFVQLHEAGRIPSDVRLVLAGDADFEDDYTQKLKESARDHGVVLTGFVKGRKLHSLLTNALCYSLPSSHEGLSIALLEAMSYRLPVIVSDIVANVEIGLPPDSYHKVGDVKSLASKIEKVVNQPLYRVTYDMTKYDWEVIARQVAEIYDTMR